MQPRRNPPRRAKRKRDELIDTVPMGNIYLNVLSEEALQNAVRNMCFSPHADDWQRVFAPEDVLCLVRMGGRYANFARSNFRALDIREGLHSIFRTLSLCHPSATDTSLLLCFVDGI